MTIADEILVLDAGEVQQFATPLDLYHQPANEFVADFIGSPSMNLFDATFRDGEGPAFELSEGAPLPIDERWADRFRERLEAGPVRIGVRPEALEFGEPGPDDVAIEGTVTIVETFGDFNWYYLESPIGDELVVQSNDEETMQSLGIGDEVTVSLSPAAIHTFDTDTHEALGTAVPSEVRRAAADPNAGRTEGT